MSKYLLIAAFSLFLSTPSFADREMAAMDAQNMADALQRQADAADETSWDADMKAAQRPTNQNMNESWDRQDAADAAQDAADAAQDMADDLADE